MRRAQIDRIVDVTKLPGPRPSGPEHGTIKADRWTGTNFADRFDGGQGSDTLYGGNGSDVLEGGTGNDILYGGNGDDILRGGTGQDRFVFMSAGEASGAPGLIDQITDFETGIDKIDLSAFMAGGKFVGTGPLVAGGGAQVAYDRSKAILSGDVNGDGVADFQIYLNGVPVVAAGDFIF